jgi:hypothetical protein
MLQISLLGFAIVAAAGVTLLLTLRLPLRLRPPAFGLEILLGIAAGSHGMGWAKMDLPITALTAMIFVVVLVLAGVENGFVRRDPHEEV